MKRISPIAVTCLVVCLLLVGGVLTAQAVEHSYHHSHHHSGTHSTLLCTWFCAAGQTLETYQVGVDRPLEFFLTVENWLPATPKDIAFIPAVSRAPPSSL